MDSSCRYTLSCHYYCNNSSAAPIIRITVYLQAKSLLAPSIVAVSLFSSTLKATINGHEITPQAVYPDVSG